MKNIFNFILVLSMAIAMSGCIENEPVVFKGALVEFDAAVLNNNATGKTFPVLVRRPNYGFVVAAANPLITRTSGTMTFRVNLVSGHKATDQVIEFSVVAEETTAVAGVHYNLPAQLVIPAGQSYGDFSLQMLDPGVGEGSVVLVVRLSGNAEIAPNQRYATLGFNIAQN
jgi:hypothetical protein